MLTSRFAMNKKVSLFKPVDSFKYQQKKKQRLAIEIKKKYTTGLYECHKEDCQWRENQCEGIKVYQVLTCN